MADKRVQIEESWMNVIGPEFEKPYFKQLREFFRNEYNERVIYPVASLLFNAYNTSPFDKVKVVILGQDPYINPGQAHGLSFSVPDGQSFPPSLRNIFKELNNDLGLPIPSTGNLSPWAKQGVFLLNAVLSVREGESGSHAGKGWELFTDASISALSKEKERLVFMLWGKSAKKKIPLIDTSKHLVLTAGHPSPLSVRFFEGCRHFSKANLWLSEQGISQIDWTL